MRTYAWEQDLKCSLVLFKDTDLGDAELGRSTLRSTLPQLTGGLPGGLPGDSVWAAITTRHRLGGLLASDVYYSSESSVRVSALSCSGEGSLPG